MMRELSIGQLKSKFSSVISQIRNNEKIVVTFGKRHEKIAIIIPYRQYVKKNRKFGLLEGKATFKIQPGFVMTDEDFLQS
jgi:antitoxin (DNA-binding transcriptional repressor) of toxin-antitoxin stability system